jgi:hypothetical protein
VTDGSPSAAPGAAKDDAAEDGAPDPVVPPYDDSCLGAVRPGAARALGVATDLPAVDLPPASRVCVVIADGLGRQLLEQEPASAPFLTSLLADGRTLTAGCPSTTATSMGSFGTGLPPGRHGLVGYEVMDPDRGVLLNELRWDPATDPIAWQPYPTLFQSLVQAGVRVVQIGNPEFDGSGLTTAALRGGAFVSTKQLNSRVDIAVDALSGPGPSLVYLYWGEVDGAGHRYGWRTREWRRALRDADRELARLVRRLPAGTLLLITADHGMLDVPHADRLDLALYPELRQGIAVLGGEGRFAQIYCEPGAGPDDGAALATRFADLLGDRAWVRTRDEAIAAGWFGPVEDRVLRRIGDVIVAGIGSFALVDSRTARPQVLELIGQHGSLTAAEQLVPLLALIR